MKKTILFITLLLTVSLTSVQAKTLVVYYSYTGNCKAITSALTSQIAAIMQTFLFNYGQQMAIKNIGLIVSSASSGIIGVEADCKRLVPGGNYYSKSLWIRSSQVANASSLVSDWLQQINFTDSTSGISTLASEVTNKGSRGYKLNGMVTTGGKAGIIIRDGKKFVIK